MAHLRPVVGESELADAFRAIADSGFKASDFSIVDHADPTPADRPYRITGTVTVTRRNGKSKGVQGRHRISVARRVGDRCEGGLLRPALISDRESNEPSPAF